MSKRIQLIFQHNATVEYINEILGYRDEMTESYRQIGKLQKLESSIIKKVPSSGTTHFYYTYHLSEFEMLLKVYTKLISIKIQFLILNF